MRAYNYSDISLIPEKSVLRHRAEADVSVEFLGWTFQSPIIPANMEAVINPRLAIEINNAGHFYIMHRFGDTCEFIKTANETDLRCISISVGVQNEDRCIIDYIASNDYRADFITIDVAHGHSDHTKSFIEYIRQHLPKTKIIVGNVATNAAIHDLTAWGAHAAKVGIAGGSVCSTKNQTGFHVPMFTCVQDCVSHIPSRVQIPIIADGGIKENGDIAKALVAGATMVMMGSLLAACMDAPGESIYDEKFVNAWAAQEISYGYSFTEAYKRAREKYKPMYKKYYGSASSRQKGNNKHVEGIEIVLQCNGLRYAEKYVEMQNALCSSVSYAGGVDLKVLPHVKWYSN